jgi:hypothetical protein
MSSWRLHCFSARALHDKSAAALKERIGVPVHGGAHSSAVSVTNLDRVFGARRGLDPGSLMFYIVATAALMSAVSSSTASAFPIGAVVAWFYMVCVCFILSLRAFRVLDFLVLLSLIASAACMGSCFDANC